MVSKPKLVVTNGRTPQREVLATAIAERDKVARSTEETRQAFNRAQELRDDAKDELFASRNKLAQVREADAAELEAAVRAGTALPASGLHLMKQKLAETENRLITARTTLDNLEASLRTSEELLRQANIKCSNAAKSVMASELPPTLVDEARQLKEQFEGKIASLGWLVTSDVLQDFDPAKNKTLHHSPLLRQGSPAAELLKQVGYNGWESSWLRDTATMGRHPDAALWQTCLEALQKDADAPLPS